MLAFGLATVLTASAAPPGDAVVAAARAQVGVTTSYDPSYVRLAYPGGDVPRDRGVCSDVVVRAFRGAGIDLQRLVHEDMAAHFRDYPALWGLRGPDRNIDHRRVPNLRRYLERRGFALPVTTQSVDYRPGDIVSWVLPNGLAHVGVVSDRRPCWPTAGCWWSTTSARARGKRTCCSPGARTATTVGAPPKPARSGADEGTSAA